MQGVAGTLPIIKGIMPVYFRIVFLANTFAFKHCIVWSASVNPMHEQDTQIQSQLSQRQHFRGVAFQFDVTRIET